MDIVLESDDSEEEEYDADYSKSRDSNYVGLPALQRPAGGRARLAFWRATFLRGWVI